MTLAYLAAWGTLLGLAAWCCALGAGPTRDR